MSYYNQKRQRSQSHQQGYNQQQHGYKKHNNQNNNYRQNNNNNYNRNYDNYDNNRQQYNNQYQNQNQNQYYHQDNQLNQCQYEQDNYYDQQLYNEQRIIESNKIYQVLQRLQQSSDVVKIVDFQYPSKDRNIKILDISLHPKGGEEDNLYAHNKFYYENVRRGNTMLIEKYYDNNTKKEECQYYWGRKGMKKFFDLQKNFILFNLREIQNLKNSFKSDQENKILHNIIFNPIQNILQDQYGDYNIEIVETVKANGENAQITYNRDLRLWVISSKNVTLLAQNRQDIQKYLPKDPQQFTRFKYACLIAETWFDILQSMNCSQKVNKIKNFLMKGNTLIGEYVGNQDCQHLVKYDKKTIIFFTVVNFNQINNENQTCISPYRAQQICQDLGLDFVEVQKRGQFKNYYDFNQKLLTLYSDIEKATIDKGEEGSVLYFLLNDGYNQTQEVLSVCKMKTLEYRFYRKLREKLKNHIQLLHNQQKDCSEGLLKKYSKEIRDLSRNNSNFNVQTTPYPIQFYEILAKKCFDYVSEYPDNCDIIPSYYITFLSQVLHCLFNGNKKVTPDMFQDYQTPIKKKWSDYNVPEFLKQYRNNEFSNQQQQQKQFQQQEQKKLKVIVPLNIPGSGKSTFNEVLKQIIQEEQNEHDIDFYQISSDQVRKKLMKQLQQRDQYLSDDAAFQRTGKQQRIEYNKELANIMRVQIPNSQCRISYLFLDKNHPRNALPDMFDQINNNAPMNYQLEIFALVPNCPINFQYSGGKYPFSLQYMVECIDRVQKRSIHPTLPGSGPKSMNVMLMFIQLFRDITFKEINVEQLGFTKCIYYQFTKEDQNIKIDPQFKEKMLNILDQVTPGKTCQNQQLLNQFTSLYEKQSFLFQKPTQEQIKEEVYKSFKQLVEYDGEILGQEVKNMKQDNYEFDISRLPNLNQDKNLVYDKLQKIDKIPIYSGIFAQDNEKCLQQMKGFLKEGLTSLKQKFKDQRLDVQPVLNQYQFPIDGIHITTYYIGNNHQNLQSEYFTSFQEKVEIPINISAFVIVPDCIITGITPVSNNDKELKGIKINNQYPHATLMTGKWTAYKSNNLLSSLYKDQPGLQSKLQNPDLEFMDKFVIEIDRNKKSQVYVYKPKGVRCINGVTKFISP